MIGPWSDNKVSKEGVHTTSIQTWYFSTTKNYTTGSLGPKFYTLEVYCDYSYSQWNIVNKLISVILVWNFFNCFSIKSHLSVTNFLNWETTTFHYLTERNIPLWTWNVEPSWRLMVLGGPAWSRHPKGHLSSSEFRFLRKSHQLVTLLTLGKFNAQSTFSWFCNLTFIKLIKQIIWQAAYNWGESMMEVD